MARKRLFLDMTCVDAARLRMRHIYDTFDTVCVQFSGGKDSTAILYLAKEVHEERGLGPVKVIFRDEEMVSPAVTRYVEQVRDFDWVDMEWYCLPQATELWVLGTRDTILMWDPERAAQGRLVREMPPWAIKAEDFGLNPSEPPPLLVDYYTMRSKPGRVAFVMGVRANESMVRYRSVTQKLNENYITRPFRMSKAVPLRFAKPIYDWVTNDVLKFIAEHNAPYCEVYDYAAMSGANTRVGIPLHSLAARRLNDVVITEPEFYDALVRAFPSIDAQYRLWADFDMEGRIVQYASQGWDGVRECINDNMLTYGDHIEAMRFASEYRKKRTKDPFAYPIDHLVRTLLLNEFYLSSPNPVGPKTRSHTVRMQEMSAEEQTRRLE